MYIHINYEQIMIDYQLLHLQSVHENGWNMSLSTDLQAQSPPL